MSHENFEPCQCSRCVKCCLGYPGWFAPGEAERAAELLGVHFEEFKKSLIKDSCDNEYAEDAPYVWAPRKVGEDQAEETRDLNMKARRGHCVFLVSERCRIHEAKPYECARAYGCRPGERQIRDGLEKMWIAAGAELGMRS